MKPTNEKYIFFVDPINSKFPGFSILIKKIISIFKKVDIINRLDIDLIGHKVIPMGSVASSIYLKKYGKGRISFLIDSPTLDFYSVGRFYFKRLDFLNKNFFGSILRYIKYYLIERSIVRKFDNVVVVSEHDANYLRNKYKSDNIRVIPNGAAFPDFSNQIIPKFNYRLGILSYWGIGSLLDVKWFIEEYLPILRIKFPGLNLVIAGRGANKETIDFFRNNGIEFIGEVDDLWDFFNNIDIYITTLRKECGILNKVLDAMAHRKIVVGLKHNMFAFQNLKNGFFSYDSVDELVNIISIIQSNPDMIERMTDVSYNYLNEKHNWTTNYIELKKIIDLSII